MKRYAYADPPYLGCCGKYDHFHGVGGGCWDELGTHSKLIRRLEAEFDGWAMSATSGSLRALLPLCPSDVRVAAWVKPFASFKPNVNPGYCWEPVIFRGARAKRDRTEPTVRDFLAQSITLRRGLTGAKHPQFCRWVLDLLGFVEGDEFVDLFPGTGVMASVLSSPRFTFTEESA